MESIFAIKTYNGETVYMSFPVFHAERCLKPIQGGEEEVWAVTNGIGHAVVTLDNLLTLLSEVYKIIKGTKD